MTDRVRGRLEAGNPRVTKLAAAHLVGLIEPEDIANMAVFLASEESRMVTGHVYPVDSGQDRRGSRDGGSGEYRRTKSCRLSARVEPAEKDDERKLQYDVER
jgi:hypothetical protein